MDSSALSRALESFLAEAPRAVVLEDGVQLFDFATARYSVSDDHGRCLLHLWSDERNTVRRVLALEQKSNLLRLTVQRFGQARPSHLEIAASRDRRNPSAKKASRGKYQRLLERVLARNFPNMVAEGLTSAMDLERSFGPIYTRGLLSRGISSYAVLGVNADESQSSVDNSLAVALLWLDLCRRRSDRELVEGLKLIVPAGTSAVVRERMAHLDHSTARFQLYELDAATLDLAEIDCSDRGNIATRLVQCPDTAALRRRFGNSIARIRQVIADAEVVPLSSAEIAFRLHGLEFARARIIGDGDSFRSREEIVFGAGPCEFPLTEANAAQCDEFLRRIAGARQHDSPRRDPLFRMQPERWLESLVVRNVAAIDPRLDPKAVYSQVPAFSASDRAMIDVLSVTRDGRLAVLELKADEDLHLPLQGLDYWARVHWHQQRGEFQRFGYFPGRQLASGPPLLFLVAPALRVHPTTDTLLRYLSPEIECELVGIAEDWRDHLRVIFRKRREASALAALASSR